MLNVSDHEHSHQSIYTGGNTGGGDDLVPHVINDNYHFKLLWFTLITITIRNNQLVSGMQNVVQL